MFALPFIPFLRLLFPYVTGLVILVCLFPVDALYFWVLMGVSVSGLVVIWIQQFYHIQIHTRYLYIIFVDLFLVSVAGITLHVISPLNTSHHISQYYTEQPVQFSGTVADVPEHKFRHLKVVLYTDYLLCAKSNTPIHGSVLVYVPYCTVTEKIAANTRLTVSGRLYPIETPKNPEEFNYKQYTADRGIYYTCYPDSEHIAVLGRATSFGLVSWALSAKQAIIQFLKNSQLTPQSAAICSALITGYDADIDQPIIDAFAATGTLHVLSVSGLHVGLIFLLLNFLFNRIDPYQHWRFTRFLVVGLLLWVFAFISGFEAPILRAVIMFNLLSVGNLLYPYRTIHPLNIVLCSAFILLIANPYLIRNIGFLLSYFAIIGLITIHPLIYALIRPKNRLMVLLWKNTSLSVAATIATLPITLYYFHVFPIWFIPCNLIVVPATYLLMCLIPCLFVFPHWAAAIINFAVEALIRFNRFFQDFSFKNLFSCSIDVVETLLLYALISCIFLAMHYRQRVFYVGILICLLMWQLWQLKPETLAGKGAFTVYHHKRLTIYGWSDNEHQRLNCTDSVFLQRVILKDQKKTELRPFNVFIRKNLRFVACAGNTDFRRVCALQPTHLLVSENQIPDSTFFLQVPVKTIIVHPHNNSKTKAQIQQLCHNFGVECWDLATRGFYRLSWEL